MPVLSVDYDDTHGFPILVEVEWGKGEFDSIYLSNFQEKSGHLEGTVARCARNQLPVRLKCYARATGCTDELRQCPDSFAVQRDPSNGSASRTWRPR